MRLMGAHDDLPRGATDAPGPWWDKVSSKFQGWGEHSFAEAGFRAVPGCVVRRGAYIAPGVVLMPSFVNIGAYVGSGTMVDTWATVGSCAQIGRNVHISGGAGIGGVLEPLQAAPTIIEDGCFIGARSEVAEGVIVEEGAVLSMGVFLGQSTKIVDRETGEIHRGRVPAYSVVVPGTLGGGPNGPALYCAVIVKRVDAQTRSKTSINELLRTSGRGVFVLQLIGQQARLDLRSGAGAEVEGDDGDPCRSEHAQHGQADLGEDRLYVRRRDEHDPQHQEKAGGYGDRKDRIDPVVARGVLPDAAAVRSASSRVCSAARASRRLAAS